MSRAELLGTVARLQLQRSPLKPGPRGARVYDPAPLVEVPEVEVTPRGLVGPDGVLDVHHADHPQTRNRRLANGLSVLPRAHYALLRDRFGPHVADGVAGESLLLDTSDPWTAADLCGRLFLDTDDDDPLEVLEVVPAPPCVEFSRWCLGRTDLTVDDEVLAAQAFLDGGVRGYYLRTAGTGRVSRGLELWRET